MAKIGINLATGSLQAEETIVGIDLGTTNSLVAIVHPDTRQPMALKEIDGFSLVPSVVYFDEHNQPVVGTQALAMLAARPERTIYSAKRLMGNAYQDLAPHAQELAYKIIQDQNNPDALVKVQVGDRFYSPIELSAFILQELKKRAEHILKTPVTKAVITVPAYFNDAQRQATRDAGKLAGLDVLRIINEPTAASLAYGLGVHPDQEQTIAVYDLGGGTFDVSILHIHDGIFEVLSTHGDTFLGGDDFDKAILRDWMEKLSADDALLQEDKSLLQELRLLAEQAKKVLSTEETFSASFRGEILSLTRTELNNLLQPIVQRTINSCRQALQDAGLRPEQIDAVVLVGGSTRVPLVKECVEDFFGKKPYDSLHPDEVVAQGAAVQADILAGKNTEVLLLDVTPLSLGIETMGGLMDVLIPRNAKIPAKAARQYTTQKDGQASMRITVFQGERDLVQDNRQLAEFHLTHIPAMPAGLPKVEISFLLDADGILKVSAKELRSGILQSIEVKPRLGLTDEAVENMLLDSLTHAEEDIRNRALAEATTEAQQMMETTTRFLIQHQSQLSAEELAVTQTHLQNLQEALDKKDKDAIQAHTEALNNVSRPFAERIMEMALKTAMKGQKI